MKNGSRIGYIDALRGCTMVLVVFHHILQLSFGLRQGTINDIPLNFRMPMFFFISGFIGYKAVTAWTSRFYAQRMGKKALVQLLPMAVFYLVYLLCFQGNPIEYYRLHGPTSYWFTLVLFEMFVIYYALSLLGHYTRGWVTDVLLVAAAATLFCFNTYPAVCRLPKGWYLWLDIFRLTRDFPFFVLGVLCRKYDRIFFKAMDSHVVRTVVLTVFIVSVIATLTPFVHSLLPKWIDKPLLGTRVLRLVLLNIAGLLTMFIVFYHYRESFESESRWARWLRFVGRRTLDIYLIHYFFLPSLTSYGAWLTGYDHVLRQVLVAGTMTVVVIALSLAVSQVLRTSRWLGHLLLGAPLKQTQ